MNKELIEGWGFSYGKYHYFRDTMSLCRRVGFFRGELIEDNGKDNNDDCKICRNKLRKEKGDKEK